MSVIVKLEKVTDEMGKPEDKLEVSSSMPFFKVGWPRL
jgi:hypothetical protein